MEICGAEKNQLSHNALFDPSACDVGSTHFLGAGPAHAVWAPSETLRPSPVLVYGARPQYFRRSPDCMC